MTFSKFQCALGSKMSPHQETNTFKDQLSTVIKAQLDFQQKIENQISMLQTMMQTVCQLVNNELISNKKCAGNCTVQQQQQQSTINPVRFHRDHAEFQMGEPRQNWFSHNNNHNNNLHMQRSKPNSADELLTFTQRMSNGKFSYLLSKTDLFMFRNTNRYKSTSLSNL